MYTVQYENKKETMHKKKLFMGCKEVFFKVIFEYVNSFNKIRRYINPFFPIKEDP